MMMKKWLPQLGILLAILILVSVMGCTTIPPNLVSKTPSAASVDPETGIQSWIYWINQKDLGQLYSLTPDEIARQVFYEQFVEDNKDNYLLKPGFTFTQYQVLNKTVNGSTANIRAVLYLQKPVSSNSTQTETIPLFFNFILLFEHGEWKVWDQPF